MHNITRIFPALFVILWASGYIGARFAMPWAEPFSFLWVRLSLSIGLLLLLVPIVKAKALPKPIALHAIIAGVLMHGIYLGGIFWAVKNGLPAGLAGLIAGLQPLLTALMASGFAGEKLDRKLSIGLLVGFLGVVLVLFPKFGTLGSGVTPATTAAALIAVLGMSLGTVWQKKFVANADLLTGTIWQCIGGLLFVIPLSLMIETRTFILTGELIFAMAWLVIVLSVTAILLLMILIRQGEVSRVASLFYLVPAVTALMAWILFDETLSPVQIVGMIITTIGVAVATAGQKKQPSAPSLQADSSSN